MPSSARSCNTLLYKSVLPRYIVDVRDRENVFEIGLLLSQNFGNLFSNLDNILGLIPCLLYRVLCNWKESAWAKRKKVKDTWGFRF